MSEAESSTDGGNWYQWGTTSKVEDEVDFVYQYGTNNQAISVKKSSTTGGIEFNYSSTVAFSTGPKAVLALVNVTTYGLIDTTVHKGTSYDIGQSSTACYQFYMHGSFNDYPPKGGWFIIVIDPNEVEYRDATQGSPALGTVDFFGWWADISGTVKAENIICDGICYVTKGDGLTLTRGDSTDPDGTFDDYIDFDEGTVTNRYGVVTTAEGAVICPLWLNIGDSAGTNGTVFADTGKVILFTENKVSAGFSGLMMYQGNAADDILLTDCFLQSRGRGWGKDVFHTIDDVDATNDVITLDSSLEYRDLDYVTYSNEGGSDSIGLTNTNSYWILWDTTNSGWAFYSTRANAAADTSRATLSDGSTGENHSFTKVNDTRADITVSGTTGIKAKLDGCTIDNFRNITLTSKGTLDSCKMTGLEAITQGSGTITGCTISGATTELGEALVTSSGLSGITYNDFTHSRGHAIERTMTAGETLTGNSFTGYGPPHIIFDTETDVDGTNDEIDYVGHGYTTGDGVYYNDKGGTETIGLTDLALYYVRAVSADIMSFHLTPEAAIAGTGKVNLTASTAGNGEDHHLYSADAAVLIANGATAVTLTITSADSPSIRSTGSGVVTVSNDVDLTITVIDVGGVGVATAQTAIYKQSDNTELMNTDTNGSGIATTTYNYTTPTPVYIRVRKSSTGSTRYKNAFASGTIDGNGLSVTITLTEESVS
jgi:hypothetical protein